MPFQSMPVQAKNPEKTMWEVRPLGWGGWWRQQSMLCLHGSSCRAPTAVPGTAMHLQRPAPGAHCMQHDCSSFALLCMMRQAKCILHESGHVFGAPHTHEWCGLVNPAETIGEWKKTRMHRGHPPGSSHVAMLVASLD